jgi:hypothetical protein
MPHAISLTLAAEMIRRYKINNENILCDEFKKRSILPYNETFDRNDVVNLLSRGAQKLRIYYGMDNDMKVHAILVGVDADGHDILPTSNLEATTDLILEQSSRCPDMCPDPSPINP